MEQLEEESGYLLMHRGGRETLLSLFLSAQVCVGGGREGAGFQGTGGALVLCPVLPPARGGVGGAGFPVLL